MREENEKKQKNIVKKAKKIRSMVMMSLLCVLMLSAATYAWFTLSNTAKVSNLTMTVGDVTGLQVADWASDSETISDTGDNAWRAETTAVEFNGKLLPATTKDGKTFLAPDYADNGSVDNTTSASKYLTKGSAKNDEGYYIEYKFWMRASGVARGKTKVKLDVGTDLNNGIYKETNPQPKGTYSLSKDVNEGDVLPSSAVRIAIIKDASAGETESIKVYEPNAKNDSGADLENAKIIASDVRGDKKTVDSDVLQKVGGEFVSSSSEVLELTNNKQTLIKLYIWIEGTDPQCGNEIAAKNIISQLKFSTVTTETQTP